MSGRRIRPSSPTVLRLAAEASRDPRTVVAAIEGRAQPMAREAVVQAANRLGLAPTDPIMAALRGATSA